MYVTSWPLKKVAIVMSSGLPTESNSDEFELLIPGQSWRSVLVSADPTPPGFMGAESRDQ